MPHPVVGFSTASLGIDMEVDISAYLSCNPRDVILHVKSSRLLLHVAKPFISFVPIAPSQLPDEWAEGTYWVSLNLFGIIPFGKQAIVISYPSSAPFTLRDNGHSALIHKWDHVITVEPSGSGTLYRDRIIINAGILTPFIWLFAQLFYRHRQRRWRQLVERGFSYDNP